MTVFLDRMINDNVNQSIASIKTHWYQLQVDLKSVRSLLEETAERWHQYTTLGSALLNWLPEAEQVLYHRDDGWQVGTSVSCVLQFIIVNGR